MSNPRYRSVLVEFHDGETKSIVVDRHEGVRVGEDRVVRFFRTNESGGRAVELYAAPVESVKGWG